MHLRFGSGILVLSGLLLCSFGFAQNLKINLQVEKYKLDNGLTIILHEDRTVPMISYHTWFKAGSRDEQVGATGAAHMLEHMMFKGSKKFSGKQFDQILHANGITNNAFTTQDYTGYYENLPSSKLELIMDVESDRFQNLQLTEEDLKSELQVVGEERRWRIDNNPFGLLIETLNDVMYTKSNYRWPVIGYMNDIQAYTVDKLKDYYNKFYSPNNAVLVIVGDFKNSEVKSLVSKYYSQLKPSQLPERNYPIEPEQKVQKNKIIRKEVQNVNFVIAFQGVPAGHADGYVLDLIATILSSGKSSRLQQKYINKKTIVSDISAFHMSHINQGEFGIFVGLKPGQDTSAILNDLYNDIWKIRNQKVSEKELERAKKVYLKDIVDSMTSIDKKARGLALNEVLFGDYNRLITDLKFYESVTVDDILRVAQKYLNQTQRTIVELKPKR